MAAIKQLIALAILTLLQPAIAQVESPSTWESSLYVDHPMVGQIFDSELGEFIAAEVLLEKIESARYLLLGEKHDNPDHHLLQNSLIDYLIEQDRVSNIAFEMLDSDQSPLLEQLSAQQINTLDGLKRSLEWDDEGWDWPFYGPLLYSVHMADIPIAAANISSEAMMRVYAEPLPAELAAVLELSAMAQLDKDIDESHCGLLPESQFPAMVRVQQARDNSMAESLQPPQDDQLAVLVAGNYHIRHDLSVPNYLLSQNEGTTREQIISLAFIEVDPSELDPRAYLQQFGERRAFDFIWFTPSISNEDYCASLQQ